MMFEAIAFNFKRKKRLSHMRQPLDFLEPLIGFEPTTLSLRTHTPLLKEPLWREGNNRFSHDLIKITSI